MEKDTAGTPLEQAVGKLNEGVAALTNAVTSMPDAAARAVSTTLHGQEQVEKVAGKFDPEPLKTLVDRFKNPSLDAKTNPNSRTR
jgi:hypothetical protein